MDFKFAAHTLAATWHKSRNLVEAVADRMGFSMLGNGCYGAAYLHRRTNLVLKVSFSLADGTMGYISKCAEYFQRTGKASEYTPEVYEFGREHKFWYAVMERVTPADEEPVSLPPGIAEALLAFVGGLGAVRGWFGKPYRSAGCVGFDLHLGNYGTSVNTGRVVVYDPFGSTKVLGFKDEVQRKVAPPYPVHRSASRWM